MQLSFQMARRSSENAHLRRPRNRPRYGRVRACWRADRIRQLRRRTLDEIHPAAGCARRPQHPNKAPQVTYLSGVLEADRRATDPADAAPAAAPSIAPGSAEPDGFGVPKTPRHGRKVAGDSSQGALPANRCQVWPQPLRTHDVPRRHLFILIKNEQRCALFYYTVRPPRGWDRILLGKKKTR